MYGKNEIIADKLRYSINIFKFHFKYVTNQFKCDFVWLLFLLNLNLHR